MKYVIPQCYPEPFTCEYTAALGLEASKRFREFVLPDTAAVWRRHRKALLDKIHEKLGVSVDHELDLDCSETNVIDCGTYTIHSLCYQSTPGHYVTGNLYVPKGEGTFPAIINLHGHWRQGRLAANVQNRGHFFVRRGYVVLCVDAMGAGERSTEHGVFEYHGSQLGGSLLNLGETLMGRQVADNMRGVDLLQSLPFVNPERIGATGGSGGGNQTMYLAALDERIKAASPVCSAGTYQVYVTNANCVCELLPDGLDFTEEAGIFALAAPRALLLCNGLKDACPTFAPGEMLRSFAEARKVFKALGVPQNLAYQTFNTPHAYGPDALGSVLGWFELHLKGLGNGMPVCAEDPAQYALPEEQLMVFARGKRPPEVEGIAAYRTRRAAEIRKKNAARTFSQSAARRALAELLRVNPEQAVPGKIAALGKKAGFECFSLRSQDGLLRPVLLKRPAGAEKRIIIMSAPFDKAELATARCFKEAMQSGAGIALFDHSASGENVPSETLHSVSDFHQQARSLIWLGRRLAGEFAADYLVVRAFIQTHIPEAQIEFAGLRDSGVGAILASALADGKIPVTTENAPLSFDFGMHIGGYFSLLCDIPGILPWGDLAAAAALTGAPVTMNDPRCSDGSSPLDEEVQCMLKQFNMRKKQFATAAEWIIK